MSFGGFGTGTGAGGFGAKPAAAATGFGATSTTGSGIGAAAPASGGRGFGGFGAAPASTGGFGAAPASTGGFGAAPASTGGFGAAPASTGGFGAAPASTGGFGAAPASTGGFGGVGSTGFGAKPGFGAAPAAGGFGAGRGFGTGATAGSTGGFGSTVTSGLGAGRGGGFGMGGGFGGMAAPAAPTAQQYPYPGIKGPGNATSWARDIDFSQVTEQVRFEALPQPLQQHLMELRSFMHAERDATKKVYSYFNESDDAESAAAATAGSAAGSSAATASSSSYRKLLAQMAALKGGGNRAVDLVAVHCNQHEGQARRQLQRLEKLEADIRDYERHVWEPLLEQGLPSSLAGSGLNVRGGAYRPAVSNSAASPFVALVEELSCRIDHVSSALTELEATLVPPGRPLRGASVSGRHGHYNGSAVPNDAIAQINAALLYELNQLRDFSCVAAHLHSRTDIARELFTRQYGQAEADVLFADTEQQRNGKTLFRRASLSTCFDIPPIQQQPAVAPAAVTTTSDAAPTTGLRVGATSALGGVFGAASGSGVFGAAPTSGAAAAATTGGSVASATAAAAPAGSGAVGSVGFGAAAPAASTATGFNAAAGGTASTLATGGFGAAPAAGLAPAAGGFGVPSTSATAAPAASGAVPSAPSMGPAAPGAAPTAFNLSGGAANTGIGFGMAPGKSGADDSGDRPSQRAR